MNDKRRPVPWERSMTGPDSWMLFDRRFHDFAIERTLIIFFGVLNTISSGFRQDFILC